MENNKKQTAKSSRFPGINLDYAVKVITEARKFGKNITNSHLAGKLSPKSGAFLRKKATLGYYGLIAGRGETLTITDLSEKIIYPKDENEKLTAVKEAFLTPDLFGLLYKSLEKNIPINVETLGNVVVRDLGISEKSKDQFLSIFISSGIFAEAIEYSNNTKNEIILVSKSQPVSTESYKNGLDNPDSNSNNNNLQTIEISLSKGKAKIIVPSEISIDDAKKLKLQIDILANVLPY